MKDPEGQRLIEEALALVRPLRVDDPTGWQRDAMSCVFPPLLAGVEREFIAWASHHVRWSLVVAEVSETVCAKPREAAVVLLVAIVADELEEGFH